MTSASFAKRHLVLEQRVRADREARAAAGEQRLRLAPCLRGHAAGDQQRREAERREPAPEILGVLLGEELGRRHECRLAARLDDIGRGERGDDGLARADVALHEAQHRVWRREVAAHFRNDAALRAREREAGAREQALRERAARGDRPGGVAADEVAQPAQRQLVREQLLEGEAALRRVSARLEHGQLRVGRRPMHVLQRLVQGRQAKPLQDLHRQEIRQLADASGRERLRGQVAQPPLLESLGDRVDRRERILDGLGIRRAGVAVLRVHDLGPVLAAAHFAETGEARAAHELLLLGAAEMEEAQGQEARAVGEAHEQGTPPAEHDLRELDRALHCRAHAGTQRADRYDMRAVLVARRQPEQKVGDGLDAKLAEPLRERGTDAPERGDRPAFDGHGTRMQSTSIAAPRGNAAAAIVTRAG